ncbi:MAG: nuclear transport factor 2 family protein [Gammaproteobacteria bacterium]|nr:nuclear transport factor 2 family protein [Gammaproteobacteria bacterium]
MTIPRCMLAAAAFVLIAQAGCVDNENRDSSELSAQEQVEDLVVCYALGTDALGRALDAIGGQPPNSTVNLQDANFAEGLALYRKCFAKDFSFLLEIDGIAALTVPDPATRTKDTDAALEWANFVNNSFRDAGYKNTQHQMGSITSSVDGNSGKVLSYLTSTHVYSDSAPLTGALLVGGTYHDDVIREQGQWFIKTRRLNITSSLQIPAESNLNGAVEDN